MKWINVKDERPGKECLAISMVKGPAYKEMLVGLVHKAEDSETGYVCESRNEILYDVTHWTIPEPPEI